MASLAFSAFAAEPTPPAPVPVRIAHAANVPARLSQLEWSVVAMAERDSLNSLREPTRLSKLMHTLFGTTPPTQLASDRLEALRRVAVHAWRSRWNVPKSELRDFVAQGFSIEQYELLQLSISKAIAASRNRGTKR